jgi:hypothetical protein
VEASASEIRTADCDNGRRSLDERTSARARHIWWATRTASKRLKSRDGKNRPRYGERMLVS